MANDRSNPGAEEAAKLAEEEAKRQAAEQERAKAEEEKKKLKEEVTKVLPVLEELAKGVATLNEDFKAKQKKYSDKIPISDLLKDVQFEKLSSELAALKTKLTGLLEATPTDEVALKEAAKTVAEKNLEIVKVIELYKKVNQEKIQPQIEIVEKIEDARRQYKEATALSQHVVNTAATNAAIAMAEIKKKIVELEYAKLLALQNGKNLQDGHYPEIQQLINSYEELYTKALAEHKEALKENDTLRELESKVDTENSPRAQQLREKLRGDSKGEDTLERETGQRNAEIKYFLLKSAEEQTELFSASHEEREVDKRFKGYSGAFSFINFYAIRLKELGDTINNLKPEENKEPYIKEYNERKRFIEDFYKNKKLNVPNGYEWKDPYLPQLLRDRMDELDRQIGYIWKNRLQTNIDEVTARLQREPVIVSPELNKLIDKSKKAENIPRIYETTAPSPARIEELKKMIDAGEDPYKTQLLKEFLSLKESLEDFQKSQDPKISESFNQKYYFLEEQAKAIRQLAGIVPDPSKEENKLAREALIELYDALKVDEAVANNKNADPRANAESITKVADKQRIAEAASMRLEDSKLSPSSDPGINKQQDALKQISQEAYQHALRIENEKLPAMRAIYISEYQGFREQYAAAKKVLDDLVSKQDLNGRINKSRADLEELSKPKYSNLASMAGGDAQERIAALRGKVAAIQGSLPVATEERAKELEKTVREFRETIQQIETEAEKKADALLEEHPDLKGMVKALREKWKNLSDARQKQLDVTGLRTTANTIHELPVSAEPPDPKINRDLKINKAAQIKAFQNTLEERGKLLTQLQAEQQAEQKAAFDKEAATIQHKLDEARKKFNEKAPFANDIQDQALRKSMAELEEFAANPKTLDDIKRFNEAHKQYLGLADGIKGQVDLDATVIKAREQSLRTEAENAALVNPGQARMYQQAADDLAVAHIDAIRREKDKFTAPASPPQNLIDAETAAITHYEDTQKKSLAAVAPESIKKANAFTQQQIDNERTLLATRAAAARPDDTSVQEARKQSGEFLQLRQKHLAEAKQLGENIEKQADAVSKQLTALIKAERDPTDKITLNAARENYKTAKAQLDTLRTQFDELPQKQITELQERQKASDKAAAELTQITDHKIRDLHEKHEKLLTRETVARDQAIKAAQTPPTQQRLTTPEDRLRKANEEKLALEAVKNTNADLKAKLTEAKSVLGVAKKVAQDEIAIHAALGNNALIRRNAALQDMEEARKNIATDPATSAQLLYEAEKRGAIAQKAVDEAIARIKVAREKLDGLEQSEKNINEDLSKVEIISRAYEQATAKKEAEIAKAQAEVQAEVQAAAAAKRPPQQQILQLREEIAKRRQALEGRRELINKAVYQGIVPMEDYINLDRKLQEAVEHTKPEQMQKAIGEYDKILKGFDEAAAKKAAAVPLKNEEIAALRGQLTNTPNLSPEQRTMLEGKIIQCESLLSHITQTPATPASTDDQLKRAIETRQLDRAITDFKESLNQASASRQEEIAVALELVRQLPVRLNEEMLTLHASEFTQRCKELVNIELAASLVNEPGGLNRLSDMLFAYNTKVAADKRTEKLPQDPLSQLSRLTAMRKELQVITFAAGSNTLAIIGPSLEQQYRELLKAKNTKTDSEINALNAEIAKLKTAKEATANVPTAPENEAAKKLRVQQNQEVSKKLAEKEQELAEAKEAKKKDLKQGQELSKEVLAKDKNRNEKYIEALKAHIKDVEARRAAPSAQKNALDAQLKSLQAMQKKAEAYGEAIANAEKANQAYQDAILTDTNTSGAEATLAAALKKKEKAHSSMQGDRVKKQATKAAEPDVRPHLVAEYKKTRAELDTQQQLAATSRTDNTITHANMMKERFEGTSEQKIKMMSERIGNLNLHIAALNEEQQGLINASTLATRVMQNLDAQITSHQKVRADANDRIRLAQEAIDSARNVSDLDLSRELRSLAQDDMNRAIADRDRATTQITQLTGVRSEVSNQISDNQKRIQECQGQIRDASHLATRLQSRRELESNQNEEQKKQQQAAAKNAALKDQQELHAAKIAAAEDLRERAQAIAAIAHKMKPEDFKTVCENLKDREAKLAKVNSKDELKQYKELPPPIQLEQKANEDTPAQLMDKAKIVAETFPRHSDSGATIAQAITGKQVEAPENAKANDYTPEHKLRTEWINRNLEFVQSKLDSLDVERTYIVNHLDRLGAQMKSLGPGDEDAREYYAHQIKVYKDYQIQLVKANSQLERMRTELNNLQKANDQRKEAKNPADSSKANEALVNAGRFYEIASNDLNTLTRPSLSDSFPGFAALKSESDRARDQLQGPLNELRTLPGATDRANDSIGRDLRAINNPVRGAAPTSAQKISKIEAELGKITGLRANIEAERAATRRAIEFATTRKELAERQLKLLGNVQASADKQIQYLNTIIADQERILSSPDEAKHPAARTTLMNAIANRSVALANYEHATRGIAEHINVPAQMQELISGRETRLEALDSMSAGAARLHADYTGLEADIRRADEEARNKAAEDARRHATPPANLAEAVERAQAAEEAFHNARMEIGRPDANGNNLRQQIVLLEAKVKRFESGLGAEGLEDAHRNVLQERLDEAKEQLQAARDKLNNVGTLGERARQANQVAIRMAGEHDEPIKQARRDAIGSIDGHLRVFRESNDHMDGQVRNARIDIDIENAYVFAVNSPSFNHGMQEINKSYSTILRHFDKIAANAIVSDFDKGEMDRLNIENAVAERKAFLVRFVATAREALLSNASDKDKKKYQQMMSTAEELLRLIANIEQNIEAARTRREERYGTYGSGQGQEFGTYQQALDAANAHLTPGRAAANNPGDDTISLTSSRGAKAGLSTPGFEHRWYPANVTITKKDGTEDIARGAVVQTSSSSSFTTTLMHTAEDRAKLADLPRSRSLLTTVPNQIYLEQAMQLVNAHMSKKNPFSDSPIRIQHAQNSPPGLVEAVVIVCKMKGIPLTQTHAVQEYQKKVDKNPKMVQMAEERLTGRPSPQFAELPLSGLSKDSESKALDKSKPPAPVADEDRRGPGIAAH